MASGPITNTIGVIGWAVSRLNEYYYRKTFGLSYEEFLSEPAEVYWLNVHIMNTINDVKQYQAAKLEKQSKRT